MTRMTRRERDTIVRAAATAAAAERGRPQLNRRERRKEGDPPPDPYAEDRARGSASPYNLPPDDPTRKAMLGENS